MLLIVGGIACGNPNKARDEARALYKLIDSLKPDDSVQTRRQKLEAISALQIEGPEAIRFRDACGALHMALLDSEIATARGTELEAEMAKTERGSPERAAAMNAILGALEKAQAGFEKTRSLTAPCERERQSFERKFSLRGAR